MAASTRFLLILFISFGVSSCKEELIPQRENLPIDLLIQRDNLTTLSISHNDICDRFRNMFTSIRTSNQGDRKYVVTSGWNFRFSERCFGQINMVFIGNDLFENSSSLSMLEMINNSITEDTEEDPKIEAEIILYDNGIKYQSILVDREWAEFGYSDPNKSESLVYEVGQDNITCIENMTTLNFIYTYSGYLYSIDRQDSIRISSSNFSISSQIVN